VSTHRVQWEICDDMVTGVLICEAPEGDICRLACAEECGAEAWPCFTYNDDGSEREHDMKGGGHCNAVLFIEQDSLEVSHGHGSEPLRSGPVNVWFDGDSYLWKYAAVSA
jgi:hypothetical protein